MAITQDKENFFGAKEHTAVAVGSSAVEVLRMNVKDLSFVGISVKNSGGSNAFTAFQVLGKFHKNDPFISLYTTGFDAAGGLIVEGNAALETLAAGATGFLVLNVLPLVELQLKATSASGTTADVRASGKA